MKYSPNLDNVPQCFLTELLPTLPFCLLKFILFHTRAQVSFEKYTNLPKIFQSHPPFISEVKLPFKFHLASATINTLPPLQPQQNTSPKHTTLLLVHAYSLGLGLLHILIFPANTIHSFTVISGIIFLQKAVSSTSCHLPE